MSSEYKPPVWSKPPKPSPQLKVVLDYFDCLSKWDLETLSQLSTPSFTQVTLPASLHIAARTKKEDIEFLHQFRDSLKGAPLEVCAWTGYLHLPFFCFGQLTEWAHVWKRLTYTMSTRAREKSGSTYVPSLSPASEVSRHIDCDWHSAAHDEDGRQRVFFLVQVWGGARREAHHQPHRVRR